MIPCNSFTKSLHDTKELALLTKNVSGRLEPDKADNIDFLCSYTIVFHLKPVQYSDLLRVIAYL